MTHVLMKLKATGTKTKKTSAEAGDSEAHTVHQPTHALLHVLYCFKRHIIFDHMQTCHVREDRGLTITFALFSCVHFGWSHRMCVMTMRLRAFSNRVAHESNSLCLELAACDHTIREVSHHSSSARLNRWLDVMSLIVAT